MIRPINPETSTAIDLQSDPLTPQHPLPPPAVLDRGASIVHTPSSLIACCPRATLALGVSTRSPPKKLAMPRRPSALSCRRSRCPAWRRPGVAVGRPAIPKPSNALDACIHPLPTPPLIDQIPRPHLVRRILSQPDRRTDFALRPPRPACRAHCVTRSLCPQPPGPTSRRNSSPSRRTLDSPHTATPSRFVSRMYPPSTNVPACDTPRAGKPRPRLPGSTLSTLGNIS